MSEYKGKAPTHSLVANLKLDANVVEQVHAVREGWLPRARDYVLQLEEQAVQELHQAELNPQAANVGSSRLRVDPPAVISYKVAKQVVLDWMFFRLALLHATSIECLRYFQIHDIVRTSILAPTCR